LRSRKCMIAQAQAENAVDTRPKNFLTEAEIVSFLQAARKGRHGFRNFAMLLLTYRHGLRVSELVNMRIADVDLDTGRLFVRRCKGSLSTSQPLEGDEIRALRAWLRQRISAPCCNSRLVFLSERGPMTRQAMNYTVAEIGRRAGTRGQRLFKGWRLIAVQLCLVPVDHSLSARSRSELQFASSSAR
jgi:integrase